MSILRAGLYERVSTEEQALRGYSIDAQIDNLTEYCKAQGYKIVGHYTDAGISGAKPPLKRPALKRLLDDIQEGKIDIVIFTKLDRWFRSVQEYFKVQEILEKHHVEWKAIYEDYDTTTANGRMAITIFMAIAQNEREKTSERIKAVFAHKIKNKEVCFSSIPFGYMKQDDEHGITRLVKNPEEQQAAEALWDIMIKTGNLAKAARHMHDVYGIQKAYQTWKAIIRNTLYYGSYSGVEGFCEPYITREQWQAIIDSRPTPKPRTGHVYLFAGMIRCPECGKTLTMTLCTRRTGNKNYYYRCTNTTTNACSWKHHISEIKTEKYLLKYIKEWAYLEIENIELEKQKVKPQTNIAALKEKMRSLNVMYMAGNMSDDEYIQEATELKELIAAVQTTPPPPERNMDVLKQFLKKDFEEDYKLLKPEDRRNLWCSIIESIEVDGNEVKHIKFRQ